MGRAQAGTTVSVLRAIPHMSFKENDLQGNPAKGKGKGQVQDGSKRYRENHKSRYRGN